MNVDVTGLTPAEQHAAVLARLDELDAVTGRLRAMTGVNLCGDPGRRRIIERHAPVAVRAVAWCSRCTSGGRPTWPCADYLDATGRLVEGLAP